MVRQRALPTALSPEEFLAVKRAIDSVFGYQTARQQNAGLPLAPSRDNNEERRQARQAAIAAIPKAAYAMPLEELSLSPRVAQHIVGAGIVSVGQLMEYSVRGDEGFLSIEGIGPKALNEIKQSLEKVVGQWKVENATPAAPEGEAPAPVEAVAPEPEPMPAKIEETTEEAQQYFIEVMSEGDKEEEGEGAAKPAGAKKSPKDIKTGKKDRVLVYDEELGRMVAQKKHKPGRFDEFEDEA